MSQPLGETGAIGCSACLHAKVMRCLDWPYSERLAPPDGATARPCVWCGPPWGQGPGLTRYEIGEQTGSETLSITTAGMPSHTHGVAPPCSNTASNGGAPAGNYPGRDLNAANGTYSKGLNATMAVFNAQSAGGGQPVDHRQPYLAISYCIALIGVFPSRN